MTAQARVEPALLELAKEEPVQFERNGVIIYLTVTILGLEQQEKFGLYFDRITNKAKLV